MPNSRVGLSNDLVSELVYAPIFGRFFASSARSPTLPVDGFSWLLWDLSGVGWLGFGFVVSGGRASFPPPIMFFSPRPSYPR